MAADVLSQSEVESLLSAIDSGRGKAAQQEAPNPRTAVAGKLRERVTAYDFKRPERVGKEQMRALQTLHEGFGRNFAVALSALLRSMVEVKLTGADQLTYSEFIFSLENPTCFNVLRADPLEGNLILDINPAILYPIIDRLLGGGKETGPLARRPLTEIELRLVGRITDLFLSELSHAWENVLEIDFAVVRVESNPQLVQIVPPNEVVVLISFELTLGDVRGMMNLCIPFNSIERIGGKLSSNSWTTYGKNVSTPDSIRLMTDNVKGSAVQLVAQLAETRITTGELIGLRVGDIITTQQDVRAPLVVNVEGLQKFHARAGSYKGRSAIRIEEAVAINPASGGKAKPA